MHVGFRCEKGPRHPLFYVLTPVVSGITYISFAVLLGHPVIAFIGWMFIYVSLTAVSNLKNAVLGEPLCAPDLETTRHLFIYPEFYVNYVGSVRFASILGGFFLAILLSYIFETSFASHQTLLPSWAAWLAGVIVWFGGVFLLARLTARFFTHKRARALGLKFDINPDTARFGFFPLMLLYVLLLLDKSEKAAPDSAPKTLTHDDRLPDIIAVQAESYFDLDRLYQRIEGHENHTWAALERLKEAGATTGPLAVAAWGASTMKSEFSFLSGIANTALGIDRINPYQRAAHTGVETIAMRLRAKGYRTVCVHPARKEFFRRSTVIPKMGFDDFIGLEAFGDGQQFGPYISDAALGDKVEALMADHKAHCDQPIFVFTITIESHGPWEAGRLANWLDEEAASGADPSGDRSFALYRTHMDNVLELFARLGPQATLSESRPRTMVLYGDHQPALRDLFDRHGLTDEAVDYILWHSHTSAGEHGPLRVEELGDKLLEIAGFRTAR